MPAGRNSRVHPKHKTRYRVTNWAEHDQALGERGNLTLRNTPEAINSWAVEPSDRRRVPQKYTDLAIETALSLRLITVCRCVRPRASRAPCLS